MALSPAPGEVYRLTAPALGQGDFALTEGARVTVAELVAPGTPGVAPHHEDTVLAEHEFDDIGRDETGEFTPIRNTRRIAVALSDFGAWFTKEQ